MLQGGLQVHFPGERSPSTLSTRMEPRASHRRQEALYYRAPASARAGILINIGRNVDETVLLAKCLVRAPPVLSLGSQKRHEADVFYGCQRT